MRFSLTVVEFTKRDIHIVFTYVYCLSSSQKSSFEEFGHAFQSKVLKGNLCSIYIPS